MATTINYRFANSISRIYTNPGHSNPPIINLNDNWANNSVLNRFARCNLFGSEIEIPIILRGNAESILKSDLKKSLEDINERELVMPVVKQDYINFKRTADSIIKLFFDNDPQQGMMVAKTNKDVIYYGNKGYIFDANFNLLFMATLVGKYTTTSDNIIVGFTYTECRVYIHPNVIIDDSDIINKGIIKKVLPFILTRDNINPATIRNFPYVDNNIKVRVLIEDASRFFITPVPMKADFTNEEMNDFLVMHKEEVAKSIKV